MKKLLPIFLLLTLSFAFSACGDSDDEPEKFVWGGDWNDPDDPNYKPEYGGKYNPIQGLWKRDGKEDAGLYFSKDFAAYKVTFFSKGAYIKTGWRPNYVINDKAFSNEPPNSEIWRYKIEKDKFYLYPNRDDDKEMRIYIRVEETQKGD